MKCASYGREARVHLRIDHSCRGIAGIPPAACCGSQYNWVMKLYRLFSPQYYHDHHPSFKARWTFFQRVIQHQREAEIQIFSKELADTCPCCSYPVFDPEGRRVHQCLICGWPFYTDHSTVTGKIELKNAQRTFEQDMVARSLTPIQPWLGWDTPVDLELHQVLAAVFDRMVGERDYELLNHLLEFCHQLLSYKAFRRDVGTQLWESHKEELEAKKIEQYEFKEPEVERTFFNYVNADHWNYLKYFLNPYHCVRIGLSGLQILGKADVLAVDELLTEDRRYFAFNLESGDPLYPAENEFETIYLHDFTGKELGRLPDGPAQQVRRLLDLGASVYFAVGEVLYQQGLLSVTVVIAYEGKAG